MSDVIVLPRIDQLHVARRRFGRAAELSVPDGARAHEHQHHVILRVHQNMMTTAVSGREALARRLHPGCDERADRPGAEFGSHGAYGGAGLMIDVEKRRFDGLAKDIELPALVLQKYSVYGNSPSAWHSR